MLSIWARFEVSIGVLHHTNQETHEETDNEISIRKRKRKRVKMVDIEAINQTIKIKKHIKIPLKLGRNPIFLSMTSSMSSRARR